jgi:glycine dehydrogenase subunit 2
MNMTLPPENNSSSIPLVPSLFEEAKPGRPGVELPKSDVPEIPIEDLLPREELRSDLPLPALGELQVVRHFTRLSQLNVGVDTVFYPLGSCTMKYNPKVNDAVAGLPGFAGLHPYQPDRLAQGALRMLKELERFLCEIGGMDAATLQPAAGAQGEFTGLLLFRAYHKSNRDERRKKILTPTSAHGTNPATAARCGYRIVPLGANDRGRVDFADLERLMKDDVAGIMMTNPNTLGLFEEEIAKIADLVHDRGGLLYCDGANMNAILGIARPGDMGFDVMHYNVHKTFSTPHGAGGPGAGPVAVKAHLEPFLPFPVLRETDEGLAWEYHRPQSIGRLHPYYGNFSVLVRAYAFIAAHGAEGLRAVSEDAVLNANYILETLKVLYPPAYPGPCMHECVLSGSLQKKQRGVRALDVAKRLLDYGFMAPTVYFPMIPGVEEAMMIEPTETETLEMIDSFVETMHAIAKEDPDLVRSAPLRTPVRRLDEARAARQPDLADLG